MSEQDHVPGSGSASDKPVARKGRGLWWKIPVALLVVLVLLILLIPTIASTSPVRNFALSKINASLPGKLDVADWSLGWFSGVSAKGISFTDPKGVKLVDISAVTTPVTLMQLVKGNLHAGEIIIPEVIVDAVVPAAADAAPNADPAQAASVRKPTQPARTTFDLPDTSATVKIEHIGGRVTFPGKSGKSATITLDKSSTLQAVLPPGGGAAKCDVNLVVVQPGTAGTITVNAVVNGLKPGTVDYMQLTGQAQVKINGLDLDQVAGIARVQGSDLAVKGLLSGQIDVNAPRPMEATVKGELSATNVTTMLGRDQIATKQLRIPIDVALTGQGDAARVAITQIGVLLDQAKLNVTADLPLAGLMQFGSAQEITQEGTAKLAVEVPDLAAVMNSLQNTMQLQKGVEVSSGRLDVQLSATLGKGGLRVQTPIALRDLSAMRDGKRIGPLQPLTVDAAATIPDAKAGANEIRDLAVSIASSFLTLNAKGSSISATNAQGECDLVKMRDDLGSIVDLSMIRGGKLTLNVVNREPEKDVLESTVRIQLAGVGLNLPTAVPATQPAKRLSPVPARRLEDANVLISLRTILRGNVLSINDPARIEVSGRVVEAAPGQADKAILDQAATVILSGTYASDAKKLHLTALSVMAGKDKPLAQLALPDGTTADLTMSGKRGVSGTAKLAVRADLGALQEIQQRYAGTAPPPAPAQGQVQAVPASGLRSGMFIGNLSVEITPAGDLKAAVDDSSVDFDYVVRAASHHERIALAASADVSGENLMIRAMVGSPSGPLEMRTSLQVTHYGTENKLEGGVVDLTPDLGRIWPIVYAMMPPAKQQTIGDLDMAGRKASHIVIGGSFPANKPYGDAIKLVTAGGDLAIESVDWKKYGVTLSGAIPFNLKDGIVRFAYADKATPPLVCNQGTIDLSKASIDLTATDPRLSIEPKSPIASKLQLNPVMISSLGAYLAPVFSSVSGSVQGTVDVVCERCDRLPLGQLMFSTDPANDGAAQFIVSINGLGVNSSALDGILGLAGGGKSGQSWQLAGDIKQASVTLEKGRCLQKLALPIGGTPLPVEGDMRLADNYYNYLKFALPPAVSAPLLSKLAGVKLAAADLPPTLDLSFAGPANALKLNTDIKSLVASVAQQQVQKRLLGGLLGQSNTAPDQAAQPAAATAGPAASQPAAQKQPDTVQEVQGLIDMFGKKKKK